jgi:predicted MFS family arabinose efflux permease
VTRTAERGSVLGTVDLVSFLASATGALAGGFLLDTAGLGVLGGVMAVILVPALVLILRLREPSPGRWELARS